MKSHILKPSVDFDINIINEWGSLNRKWNESFSPDVKGIGNMTLIPMVSVE